VSKARKPPAGSFSSARLNAVRPNSPWAAFAHGLMTMIPVESREVPVAAVDLRWRCYWNPDALATRPAVWSAAVLVHELWHLLRRHPVRARRVGLVADGLHLWQLACDVEIHDNNAQLVAALSGQQADPVTRASFDPPLAEFGVAESWYRELLDRNTTVRLTVNGAAALCPLGVGGEPIVPTGEPGAGEPGWGGFDDPDLAAVSDLRADVIRRVVAQEILKESRARGSNPGSAVRWAEEVCGLVVDWRQSLPAAMGVALAPVLGHHHWTYARPSRRNSGDRRVVNPAWLGVAPEIAIILDTSGSMSDRWLGICKGEVTNVVQSLARDGRRPAVTVYATDAAAAEAQSAVSGSTVQLFGGGGTDMRQGFLKAADDRKDTRPYDCVIVMTDGWTPWPLKPPDCPVVALMFTDEKVPAWLQTPPSAVIRVPPEVAGR
jgi:predicted metal-dependent peptidase